MDNGSPLTALRRRHRTTGGACAAPLHQRRSPLDKYRPGPLQVNHSTLLPLAAGPLHPLSSHWACMESSCEQAEAAPRLRRRMRLRMPMSRPRSCGQCTELCLRWPWNGPLCWLLQTTPAVATQCNRHPLLTGDNLTPAPQPPADAGPRAFCSFMHRPQALELTRGTEQMWPQAGAGQPRDGRAARADGLYCVQAGHQALPCLTGCPARPIASRTLGQACFDVQHDQQHAYRPHKQPRAPLCPPTPPPTL